MQDFFRLVNNAVLGKTMKYVRKHRNIKLVTTKMKRKIYLALEPSYHNEKFFTETLLAIERKTSNKPVYLGLSILDLGKTVMV